MNGMCGIAGYYLTDARASDSTVLLRMIRSIAHRGPDDEGFSLIENGANATLNLSGAASDASTQSALRRVESYGTRFPHDIAFAHRRYSIIDLSSGGHQPMWDASGQVCVSFNGEVFNFVELRDELARLGRQFRTNSDTEVLLEAYLQWGPEVFSRINGPCALSLYDRRSRKVLLGRDRLGKAPLYLAMNSSGFYWASEIKALRAGCGIDKFPVRSQAVDDYVMHGWRDIDGTFWHGVTDFPPGCWAWLEPGKALEPKRYWSLPDRPLEPSDLSPVEAAVQLRELLVDATRIRLRADVPVAFELSGGMDSSTLVALAASDLGRRVVTYTVKFPDKDSDEEPIARSVAQHFPAKVDYRVLQPAFGDFWRDANEFVALEEEPFHAPSLHANQLVRRLMRRDGAKVVITGAGGDEVLAGYASEYFAPFLRHLLCNLRLVQFARELARSTEYPFRPRTTLSLCLAAVAPELFREVRRWRYVELPLLARCYRRDDGQSSSSGDR